MEKLIKNVSNKYDMFSKFTTSTLSSKLLETTSIKKVNSEFAGLPSLDAKIPAHLKTIFDIPYTTLGIDLDNLIELIREYFNGALYISKHTNETILTPGFDGNSKMDDEMILEYLAHHKLTSKLFNTIPSINKHTDEIIKCVENLSNEEIYYLSIIALLNIDWGVNNAWVHGNLHKIPPNFINYEETKANDTPDFNKDPLVAIMISSHKLVKNIIQFQKISSCILFIIGSLLTEFHKAVVKAAVDVDKAVAVASALSAASAGANKKAEAAEENANKMDTDARALADAYNKANKKAEAVDAAAKAAASTASALASDATASEAAKASAVTKAEKAAATAATAAAAAAAAADAADNASNMADNADNKANDAGIAAKEAADKADKATKAVEAAVKEQTNWINYFSMLQKSLNGLDVYWIYKNILLRKYTQTEIDDFNTKYKIKPVTRSLDISKYSDIIEIRLAAHNFSAGKTSAEAAILAALSSYNGNKTDPGTLKALKDTCSNQYKQLFSHIMGSNFLIRLKDIYLASIYYNKLYIAYKNITDENIDPVILISVCEWLKKINTDVKLTLTKYIDSITTIIKKVKEITLSPITKKTRKELEDYKKILEETKKQKLGHLSTDFTTCVSDIESSINEIDSSFLGNPILDKLKTLKDKIRTEYDRINQPANESEYYYQFETFGIAVKKNAEEILKEFVTIIVEYDETQSEYETGLKKSSVYKVPSFSTPRKKEEYKNFQIFISLIKTRMGEIEAMTKEELKKDSHIVKIVQPADFARHEHKTLIAKMMTGDRRFTQILESGDFNVNFALKQKLIQKFDLPIKPPIVGMSFMWVLFIVFIIVIVFFFVTAKKTANDYYYIGSVAGFGALIWASVILYNANKEEPFYTKIYNIDLDANSM